MPKKTNGSSTSPKMLSNIGRGDFVVLKRHMNNKGEISKKARVGTVRKTSPDGYEVIWTNKSDKKQSMVRKKHNPDSLHVINGDTARKVSQFLHKHIAKRSSEPEVKKTVDTPENPQNPDNPDLGQSPEVVDNPQVGTQPTEQ